MTRILDVEHTLARQDEAARHDLGIDLARHRAVVPGVPLETVGGLRVVLLVSAARRLLVDLEAHVGHDVRLAHVVDVDEPRCTNWIGRAVARDALGELVHLEQVLVVVDGHRDRHLRDRDVGPADVRNLLHLRIGHTLLDLADVEDRQTRVTDVSHVEVVAVIGNPHAVIVRAVLGEQYRRQCRIREVDGSQRLATGRGDVERLPVRGEAALVAEYAERRG